MSKPKEPKKPFNPRVRANVYALAALYLVYLFYQIAKPYLTRDPYGPTSFQFTLGAVVLGGGAAVLAAVTAGRGSVPRGAGAQMLVELAGCLCGGAVAGVFGGRKGKKKRASVRKK